VPRKSRRLPVGITRFNFWDYEVCRPMAATALARRRRLVGDPVQVAIRERFLHHLQGACGEPECAVDRGLAQATPAAWPELALADFIETSRLWERDRQAQRVFNGLPAHVRLELRKRSDRLYGRVARRRWATLLAVIAKDQLLFARMLPCGPTQIMKSTDSIYPSAKKTWTTYARQAIELLGLGTGRASGVGRQRPRLDLRTLTPAQQAAVVHWFAHAFRNLVRYRDGHPSRPFVPACAATCRGTISRF